MTPKKRGRKPIADKKKPITVFVPQSQIDRAGGEDQIKSIIKKSIKYAMDTI